MALKGKVPWNKGISNPELSKKMIGNTLAVGGKRIWKGEGRSKRHQGKIEYLLHRIFRRYPYYLYV